MSRNAERRGAHRSMRASDKGVGRRGNEGQAFARSRPLGGQEVKAVMHLKGRSCFEQ